MAKKIVFKPFLLIDLTVLSDEQLLQDGLAFLMEILLKHSRANNFLTILNQRREAIKEILKQLKRDYRRFVLKYVINETQDEEVPNAVEQLVHILTTDLPEEKEIIMTFAQQLEQKGLQKGLQQGEYRKALLIARNLLNEKISLDIIKSATGLSEKDLALAEDAEEKI